MVYDPSDDSWYTFVFSHNLFQVRKRGIIIPIVYVHSFYVYSSRFPQLSKKLLHSKLGLELRTCHELLRLISPLSVFEDPPMSFIKITQANCLKTGNSSE